MLVDIIRLPNPIGLPIDRRTKLIVPEKNKFPIDYFDRSEFFWPDDFSDGINKENITVGSIIDTSYHELYKSFHISSDDKFVFETIFSIQNGQAICWYIKCISKDSNILGISSKGIGILHKNNSGCIYALGNLMDSDNAFVRKTDTRIFAVPPIFGNDSFYNYLSDLMADCCAVSKYENYNKVYLPIRHYEIGLFYGLVNGNFLTSPTRELRAYYPFVDIRRHRFSLWDEILFRREVTECTVICNHELFDDIVVKASIWCPIQFSITCLMSHVVDGIHPELWLNMNYHDPYQKLFFGRDIIIDKYKNHLKHIFQLSLDAYWKIYGVSYTDKNIMSDNSSTVTIVKNNYEEIAILFEDRGNNRKVCFYTSIPSLMMTTLAMGWYDYK